MPVVSLGRFCNGFTVGYFGGIKISRDLENVIKMPFHYIQMVFTLSMDNDLLKFLGVFDYYRRILKMDLIECFTKLLIITFGLSFNCSTVFRLGEFYSLIPPVIARSI